MSVIENILDYFRRLTQEAASWERNINLWERQINAAIEAERKGQQPFMSEEHRMRLQQTVNNARQQLNDIQETLRRLGSPSILEDRQAELRSLTENIERQTRNAINDRAQPVIEEVERRFNEARRAGSDFSPPVQTVRPPTVEELARFIDREPRRAVGAAGTLFDRAVRREMREVLPEDIRRYREFTSLKSLGKTHPLSKILGAGAATGAGFLIPPEWFGWGSGEVEESIEANK